MTRRRLRSLALLEWGNIPLQAAIWFGYVGLPVTAANLVGFALFGVLLVQGGAYWFLKGIQVRHRHPRLPAVGVFRTLRTVNVVALVAGGVAVGYGLVRQPAARALPGAVFLVVAALEHVNYFHVQLMHDTRADLRRLRSSGLRRSHLAADLRSGETVVASRLWGAK